MALVPWRLHLTYVAIVTIAILGIASALLASTLASSSELAVGGFYIAVGGVFAWVLLCLVSTLAFLITRRFGRRIAIVVDVVLIAPVIIALAWFFVVTA